MKSRRAFVFAIMTALLVCGCQVAVNKPAYPAMPVQPDFTTFSRKPVIEQLGKDYRVSDEFVNRAAQEHEYVGRVRKWKSDNAVP